MSDENTDHTIFEAVLTGDMSCVQRLLADGVGVNIRQQGGGTPLILAASEGRLDLTCYLVEHGADVDAQYDAGNTALIEASANGHLDVVKYLVEKGADVHIRENECESPLEWAAGHGHLDVVKFLVSRGARINGVAENGGTALTGACEWGQAVEVVKYLIAQGAEIEARAGRDGFSPLVAAAYQGHTDIIDLLVKAGANIHVDDDAPLEWATLFDQWGSVRSLLAAGADPDSRLNRESTALTSAVADARPNRTKIINALLDAGVDVNRGRKDGATALHEAAETGQVDLITLLIERGANVSAATESGDTPAITAARHGREPIGFGSFDPRQRPATGIIGHNCILPEFRGQGCGKQQIIEILKRFIGLGIQTAKVTTHDNSFFAPAHRMYESCGFKETGREPWDSDPKQSLIHYQKRIG